MVHMELRQLSYFIAVAESLNFRKAAERLHITQASVSRQIAHLEEDLGVKLFVRDKRHVHLTENGRLALSRAKSLAADAADFSSIFARSSNVETVRVGICIPLTRMVQDVVLQFKKRFPKVNVIYQNINTSVQNAALRVREIDVGICWPPVDHVNLASAHLFDAHFGVQLSKFSPLAKRRKLQLRELVDMELLLVEQEDKGLYRKIMRLARDAGVELKIKYTTAMPQDAGAAMILTGNCFYLLPFTASLKALNYGTGVSTVPLDQSPSVEVYVAWRRKESSIATLNFVETTREMFREPSSGDYRL
jgi:DNA-binding transcriptional LysR family regulator